MLLTSSKNVLILVAIFTLAAAKLAAWTKTVQINSSGTAIFQGEDLPSGSVADWVHLPNYTSATPPDFYFCVEIVPIFNTSNLGKPILKFRTTTTPTNPYPNGAITDINLGTWTPVAGQTNAHTFAWPSPQPSGYSVIAPSSPASIQYKLSYKFYGKAKGSNATNTAFIMPYWVLPTNGSIKLTISDQPLLEKLEPDVIAQPITHTWGAPYFTVNGVNVESSGDVFNIPSPIPAYYTLGWNIPPSTPAMTFLVTGGTGNGAMPAGGQNNGVSRNFTNVPVSNQTYVLTTQGPASISWKLSKIAFWEIFLGNTYLGSGTGSLVDFTATQTGLYKIKINGLDKNNEDEIINVTDGFLKRAKKVTVRVGQ